MNTFPKIVYLVLTGLFGLNRRATVNRLIALGMAVLAFAGKSSQASMNLDLNDSDGGFGTYSGLGAAGAAAGTTWTGINLGPRAGTPNAPFSTSSDIDPSLAGDQEFSMTGGQTYDWRENPATFAGALLNDGITIVSVNFTISGLPAGTYNLYVYAQNGGYGSADTGVSGITGDGGATTQTANIHNGSGSIGAFNQGVNYAHFTIAVPTTGGSISGSLNATSGNGYAFNGFQLVLPEPASLSLLAAGGLVLKRRNRRVA